MDMAKAVTFPLPLLGVAYQQLIHGMLKAFLHVSLFSSQSGYHMARHCPNVINGWNQRLETIHPCLLSVLLS